jgi:Uma2 family endonuclease
MLQTTAKTRRSLADLLSRLGDIPPARILVDPALGTATELDVERALDSADKRLTELIDGVLVEKPTGIWESSIAFIFAQQIQNYLDRHDIGIAFGPDGALRIIPGRVCAPDISFVAYDQLPGGELPEKAVPDLFPNLAIEILTESNTPAEMARKIRDYFRAGTRLVWIVDRRSATVDVYTSPRKSMRLTKDDSLDGGDVLPGFSLPLATIFARRGRRKRS